MSAPTSIRIATRESPLALWQANYTKAELLKHWPKLSVTLIPMKTSGDRFLNTKLLEIGGKGLFVKELEEALLKHEADLAVHSMKDVPSTLPEGLVLNTLFARQNPLDAFVSNQIPNLASLPKGAIIGTSSLRRAAQIQAFNPDVCIKPIRGNVGTRLSKLDNGEFDALILAATGLERLGLDARIQETIPEHIILPAAGQGALGIETRAEDEGLKALLAPLHDEKTAIAVQVERHINLALGGSCHTPIAVFCRHMPNDMLLVKALVAKPDGKQVIQAEKTKAKSEAHELAEEMVSILKQNGVEKLLHEI